MYTGFEQDLILACKCHYGSKGIEKVIRDYIGYGENQEIKLDSKYHFISELFLKLCNNGHLKYIYLLDRLSPRNIYDQKHMEFPLSKVNYNLYDLPRIVCDHMIGEIQGVRVKDGNKVLIELHENNKKYIEEEKDEKNEISKEVIL
jgi:hypothetical protein